ncbi:hypothetical protein CYMTET_16038, partial [Cymbomonas tetramitiformis]
MSSRDLPPLKGGAASGGFGLATEMDEHSGQGFEPEAGRSHVAKHTDENTGTREQSSTVWPRTGDSIALLRFGFITAPACPSGEKDIPSEGGIEDEGRGVT